MSSDDVENQEPPILVKHGCQPTCMIVHVNAPDVISLCDYPRPAEEHLE